MKNSKQNKRAEEILANELLFEKLKSGELAENISQNEEEIRLARKMHKAIINNSHQLTKADKYLLKSRFNTSIKSYKKRKIIYTISSAAAIVIVLFAISILYLQDFTTSEIGKYAESTVHVPISDKTMLILQDSTKIQINSADSKIEYLDEEGRIKIDAEKEIGQKVSKAKTQYNTIIVPYGKRTKLTLADNTKIWLNSGSKLVYPAAFTGNKREVYLSGEAFFEVAHNEKQPFYVLANDIEIRVLGTVFNVSAYDDEHFVNTVLESGSVELKYKSNSLLKHSKIQIVPGTLAKYDPLNKVIQQQKVDTKYYTSWRDGALLFKSEHLINITRKLSRYYNIEIVINNNELMKETFSGSLDLKNSAMEVLEIIGETSDFKITQDDNKIIIN